MSTRFTTLAIAIFCVTIITHAETEAMDWFGVVPGSRNVCWNIDLFENKLDGGQLTVTATAVVKAYCFTAGATPTCPADPGEGEIGQKTVPLVSEEPVMVIRGKASGCFPIDQWVDHTLHTANNLEDHICFANNAGNPNFNKIEYLLSGHVVRIIGTWERDNGGKIDMGTYDCAWTGKVSESCIADEGAPYACTETCVDWKGNPAPCS